MCWLRKQRRYKFIVMLSVIGDFLGNQVYYFSLKFFYVKVIIRFWMVIINYYKFQVWDEFKIKFYCCVVIYVVDWMEDWNYVFNDCVLGFGIKFVKFKDWEFRYCEVYDYGF